MNKIVALYNSLDIASFKERVSKLSPETLQKIKKNLDNRYYNTGEDTITDLKYDLLVEILTNSTNVSSSVGCKLRDSDNITKLPFFLGSMDKIKKDEIQKLENWKGDNKHKNYVVSDKLNGVSCLLVYTKGGKTPKIYTRGDGKEGADISYLFDKITGINDYKFLDLDLELNETLSVRGELIIEQEVFNRKYSNDYKNSLSLIVGNVNSKTMREALANKDIRFVAYEIINSNAPPKKNLEYLKSLHFEVVPYQIINFEDLTNNNLSKILLSRKNDSNNSYDIDGIIIHSNVVYENPIDRNPKYAFAFKMLLDTVEAIVEDVEWNASKWGVLKPRIKISPVQLSGITINYTTGFNAAFIKNNKINKGSKVLITRSGEIIPYIVEVISQSLTPKFPSDDVKYNWNENNIDILLINKDDTSKIKSIVHFFVNLNIEQINEGVVRKLYDSGFNEVEKILGMNKEDFLKIPTFKEKMAERLYTNISNLFTKKQKLYELMCASSVFGMGLGKKKAEALCKGVDNNFNNLKVEDINKLDGFSTKTSEKIVENLPKFVEFLDRMKKFGIEIEEKEIDKEIDKEIEIKKDINDYYINEYVVFSGFRDKKMEEEIKNGGGFIQSSINKKTTLLIIKKGCESSKVEKAKEMGIKLLIKN